MRHLIDTYIEARAPQKISPFDDMGLLDLIAKVGMDEAIGQLPEGVRGSRDAVAETIENNVRSRIIKEHLTDPVFYERMSALLEEVIRFRKERADHYKEYLEKIADLVSQVQAGHGDDLPEELRANSGLRAVFNNLRTGADSDRLELAKTLDRAVRESRPAVWRGNPAKENVIKAALMDVLDDEDEVERIFQVILQQSEY
jgi:type I restriction enzyme R subunit